MLLSNIQTRYCVVASSRIFNDNSILKEFMYMLDHNLDETRKLRITTKFDYNNDTYYFLDLNSKLHVKVRYRMKAILYKR